ncbi:FAD-binding domain-containing protein [Aspergillus heteromorphus CBS 117.55]|uniref:FAD-binding domain-containing protein n=1 Tax=Aspergillus heteromorphus CBS 117.55 TaxID=1448321 RepID=A0A317WEV4_9EURO|nr:FAD-binding domain-containing protein [Aspergillus heteromorphus CBS 117.55]PWY85006.1 FAD-binding domain-containing protein [Aspergillus heteromorphus CBS 117.55]
MTSVTVVAVLLVALFRSCLAQSTGNQDRCCAALKASAIGDRTAFPGSITYKGFLHSYYASNAELHPNCIVQPLSAQDISVTVQTLTNSSAEPCFFAVRSGGHVAVTGAANIEHGVTIDLSMMNGTTYSPRTGTASIQTGAPWGSVYETLLRDNVTVPGGRVSPIGAGGFLTGGGISFHAARVGISCDNVQGYEVVLASGEIVNVTQHSYPDLFRALKGGSNNFGIVTTFDMPTQPAEDVWRGDVVYNISHTREFISAATEFVDNIATDPFASFEGIFSYNSTTDLTLIGNILVYTRPVARPAAYHAFYQIPNITDISRLTTIMNITEYTYVSYRIAGRTGTYLNRADIIHKATRVLSKGIRAAKSRAQSKDFSVILVVQPWVPLFWKNSQARGGNVLGLERFDQNMINIDWSYFWNDKADDGLFDDIVGSAQVEMDEYAKSTGAYNEFIYLHYAGRTQNPLRGYGRDNVEFMRQVSRKYDPQGVFQRLVPGGFKISSVGSD